MTSLSPLQPAQWPTESISPVGYLSRKALPIKKRNDAEPLTREDTQYDLLHSIFSDSLAVFTSPFPSNTGAKITFRELYVNALYNSTKCSKILKEKMVETPAFAVELAKISLLTNVGRINTTMAFFPEMKTALRTYHPVPSLQKTNGNAQDAPRIKNCLKAALLPSEFKTIPPSTPEEILERNRAGHVPSTSVVNLVFVLSNHASPLAHVHFESPLNFLDLFLPINISSADRARAFLWLMFHYLEQPSGHNPFDDEFSRRNPGKVPLLRRLTDEELMKENVDTEEELEWGKKMSAQRNMFLTKLFSESMQIEQQDTKRTVRRTNNSQAISQAFDDSGPVRLQSVHRPSERMRDERFHDLHLEREIQSVPVSSGAILPGMTTIHSPPTGQHRMMLQHAFCVVSTTDPLSDSDEEGTDEHFRLDYLRKLHVINRLRGAGSSPRTPDPTPSWVVDGYPSAGQEMSEPHDGRY